MPPKDKDDIEDDFAAKLVHVRRKEISWGDIVSAINSSNQDMKDGIIEAIKGNDREYFSKVLFNIIESSIKADSKAEAKAILAGTTVKVSDLIRILSK